MSTIRLPSNNNLTLIYTNFYKIHDKTSFFQRKDNPRYCQIPIWDKQYRGNILSMSNDQPWHITVKSMYFNILYAFGPSCSSSACAFIASMQIAATSRTSIPSIPQPCWITSRLHFGANFLSLNFFIKLDISMSVIPAGRILAAAWIIPVSSSTVKISYWAMSVQMLPTSTWHPSIRGWRNQYEKTTRRYAAHFSAITKS